MSVFIETESRNDRVHLGEVWARAVRSLFWTGSKIEVLQAIQVIGLGDLQEFRGMLERELDDPDGAPAAALAYARLVGIESLALIQKAYDRHLISPSQWLIAVAELPREPLLQYLEAPESAGRFPPLALETLRGPR
jgi:hypothetical protein